MDNINVSKVFALVEDEFMEYIRCEFAHSASQLDILVDIISRDCNSIMKLVLAPVREGAACI